MDKVENIEQNLQDMKVSEENKPAQNHPDPITIDYVMSLTDPADRFLCKLVDNVPKFKFGGFKIRDMVSKITLVEVPA